MTMVQTTTTRRRRRRRRKRNGRAKRGEEEKGTLMIRRMTNVKNVFVRSMNSTRTRCYQLRENTLACLRETVERSEGIPRERLLFLGGPRVVDDANEGDIIESNATYQLWVKGGLGGGKGGFGTLLRSTGKKKGRNNAEPNNDLCRDLKGQRYHVSENARKMEQWTKEESLREEESLALRYIEEQTGEKARKRAKMEKEEEQFRKDSEEVKERMEEAIKAASTTLKTSTTSSSAGKEDEDSDDDDDEDDEDDFRKKKKKKEGMMTEQGEKEEEEKEEKDTKENKKKEEKAEANKKEPQLSSSKSSPPKQENFEPIDLNNINTAQELERFGLDHLKIELTRQKLKCGGSLEERANRLFLLKTNSLEAIDKKHKAKK
jgi:hypothetical protein